MPKCDHRNTLDCALDNGDDALTRNIGANVVGMFECTSKMKTQYARCLDNAVLLPKPYVHIERAQFLYEFSAKTHTKCTFV